MSDLMQEVTIGEDTGPLAAIAEFDMSGIEERRASALPIGGYHFRCKEAKLEAVDVTVDGVPAKRAVVMFIFEVLGVLKIADPEWPKDRDVAELVGKEHREAFFLKKLEDFGYMKAFAVDCGVKWEGKLGDGLALMMGREIKALITRRKDKNDASKTYTNIDRTKIEPVA